MIGPPDAIQTAADNISETDEIEIMEIGEFRSSQIDIRAGLTQRQFEAVTAAVDTGYYEVPRQSTLDDIASRLECSTGTAGELLRRAEKNVMSHLLTNEPLE